MFELPEFITLARQINETLTGKVINRGSLGNTPHKFVWYNKDMRTTPVDPGFTYKYFSGLVDTVAGEGRRSVKGLLTQEQLIPGLGNAIAQDIMFRARLHPRHPVDGLDKVLRRGLYDAIIKTVREVIAKGGRCDEHDLYDRPGGYERVMDSEATGRPCPECGDKIAKMQYLGGACYFCPSCQK